MAHHKPTKWQGTQPINVPSEAERERYAYVVFHLLHHGAATLDGTEIGQVESDQWLKGCLDRFQAYPLALTNYPDACAVYLALCAHYGIKPEACSEADSKPRLLDCGHMPTTPHSTFTMGYGTDANGARHCYACCAVNDSARMVNEGAATFYLSKVLDGTGNRYEVSNWPGSLVFPVISWSTGCGGFGSKRVDAWFHGPDGWIWHAIQRGDNEIARCRRTVKRKL